MFHVNIWKYMFSSRKFPHAFKSEKKQYPLSLYSVLVVMKVCIFKLDTEIIYLVNYTHSDIKRFPNNKYIPL